MSVLAERKEKRKWSIDPRGTNWSKDNNKFGMKMLEKMGWSKGKGLGANEDGLTDHIKVKVKNDNLGVGCGLKDEKNWVAHQDDFSSLLAELNDHHTEVSCHGDNQKEVASLEKNSKSQRRVHYQKFTRGKDLSNYKANDLAAIFGKTASQSAPHTPVNLSEDDMSGIESTSSCPETKGKSKRAKKNKKRRHEEGDSGSINQVTSTLTVQEYFAQRLASLGKTNSRKSHSFESDGLQHKKKRIRACDSVDPDGKLENPAVYEDAAHMCGTVKNRSFNSDVNHIAVAEDVETTDDQPSKKRKKKKKTKCSVSIEIKS